MHSFAVVAGLAAAANAHAVAYPAASSIVLPAPVYAASSAVASLATPAPVYAASSPAPSAAQYTTQVIKGLTTVCESTTLTYGSKTYTVSSSTTLIDEDCEITTSYPVVKPTPVAASSTSTLCTTPAYVPSASAAIPYPSAGNATVPHATGAVPVPVTASKPSAPQFTGAAAAQAGVGLMAVVGAVAAFL